MYLYIHLYVYINIIFYDDRTQKFFLLNDELDRFVCVINLDVLFSVVFLSVSVHAAHYQKKNISKNQEK